MDRKVSNKLLAISSLALGISGLALILINIFSDVKDSGMLTYGLLAILLGNLFNYIRINQSKKDK